MADTTNVEARKNGALVAEYDGITYTYDVCATTEYPDERGRANDGNNATVIGNAGERNIQIETVTITAYDGGKPETNKEQEQEK